MTIKHGHRKTRTPTYNSWRAMKYRCLNPKHEKYPQYGGRGIKIDPNWMKFENFLNDMGERPSNMTLDRINTNGNYEKSNCRWATKEVQEFNKRSRY